MIFTYFFQPFAQYRNPITFYYAQSYPLPPKATLIGLFQRITNRYYDEDFWDLKISIHGGFESRFWNLQQLIGTSRIGFIRNQERAFIGIKSELQLGGDDFLPLYGHMTKMLAKAYRSGMTHQEELFNGHIYLFIKGREDLLEDIYTALKKPPTIIRLGRSEDIVFVREVLWIPDSDNVILEERRVKNTLMLSFPTYLRLVKIKDEDYVLTDDCIRRFPTYMIPIRQSFYIVLGNRKKSSKPTLREEKIKIRDIYELFSAKFKERMREVEFEIVLWTGFNAILEFRKETRVWLIKITNRRRLKFWIIDDIGWL